MTKQISTAVLAIIVSLFPIGDSISPPVVLAQKPPQVECLEESDNSNPRSRPRPSQTPTSGGSTTGPTDFLTNEITRDEKGEREWYIQEFAKKLSEKFPGHNIVIVHNVGQVTGDHFTHTHCELDVPFGETIGYEIYLSPMGKPFTLEKDGDGGFQNWYYIGNFERSGNTLKAE